MLDKRCGIFANFVKQLEIAPTVMPPIMLKTKKRIDNNTKFSMYKTCMVLRPKIDPKTRAVSKLMSGTFIREKQMYPPSTSGKYKRDCSNAINNVLIMR